MGVSQGFESYNYIVNQWFAWHDSFLLSHHLNFPKRPYSSINTLIYNDFTAFQSLAIRNHPVESDTECV